MKPLTKWIMRLYPASWRARYGDEVDALLADAGSDARVVADLLQGGIRMRISMWSFSKLAPMLAIGGMLVGFGASFLMTPVYTSKATMQITPARIDTGVDAIPDLNETIREMEEAVLSRRSLARIINDSQLELYRDERKTVPLEDVVEKMKRNIRIQFVSLPGGLRKQTSAFDISFTYPDRLKAQHTVWALMNRFDEQNQAVQKMSAGEPLFPSGEVLDVLDTASLPKQPTGPERSMYAGTGLVCGLFAAVVVAIIRRIRRQPAAMSLLTPNA